MIKAFNLNRCYWLFVFLLLAINSYGQIASNNKYGLKIIDNLTDYEQSIQIDSNNVLIDLEKYIPSLVLDIRYATANNFMHEPLYKLPKAFVRLPVAKALKNIQEELAQEGLGLKIFDGYRPYRVTVNFYDKLQDSVFLAVPWRGSRHNRGSTVDLTIISLKTGKELKMPTGYDKISAKSDVTYAKLPARILRNREKLLSVMGKHGFAVYQPEWWHFDFHDFARFSLLDLTFEDIVASQIP